MSRLTSGPAEVAPTRRRWHVRAGVLAAVLAASVLAAPATPASAGFCVAGPAVVPDLVDFAANDAAAILRANGFDNFVFHGTGRFVFLQSPQPGASVVATCTVSMQLRSVRG
jgi:hypothetical protein